MNHIGILRDGDSGVGDTICIMVKYAVDYAKNAQIKQIAMTLQAADDVATFKNIVNYVWRKVRYTSDPADAELVKSPKHTILGKMNYGDCDDQSVAVATLCLSLGYPVKFKTIAWKKDNSNFSHVYCIAYSKQMKGWIPLDATLKTNGVGREVKTIYRSELFNIGVKESETCRIG